MNGVLKPILFIVSILYFGYVTANSSPKGKVIVHSKQDYPRALVDFESYKKLVEEVESLRSQRLVSLDTFLKMAQEKSVIVLDSRSEFRYNRKHLKGSLNLSFSDYTQKNLEKLIPDKNTKILIYCNNNFEGDQIDFTSKIAYPGSTPENQILSNQKPTLLALNIPTFINLFGYGYKNIYELNELVNVKDSRIVFEGTNSK